MHEDFSITEDVVGTCGNQCSWKCVCVEADSIDSDAIRYYCSCACRYAYLTALVPTIATIIASIAIGTWRRKSLTSALIVTTITILFLEIVDTDVPSPGRHLNAVPFPCWRTYFYFFVGTLGAMCMVGLSEISHHEIEEEGPAQGVLGRPAGRFQDVPHERANPLLHRENDFV